MILDNVTLVPPTVRLAARLSDDLTVAVVANGPPGVTLFLESSEDLRAWKEVQALPLPASGTLATPVPSVAPRMFLRARIQPVESLAFP